MNDRAISDYAIIGDTNSTALVSRDGAIDWLCWPCHDSPAVFLALLDGLVGGSCRVAIDGLRQTSRRYRPGTAILETTFVTETGKATLVDLMPIHPLESVPQEGPDGSAKGRLLRRLTCEEGTVSGRWSIRPTFDYARVEASVEKRPDGTVLFRGCDVAISAYASVPLSMTEAAAEGSFALRAGQCADLILADGKESAIDIAASIDATNAYWEAWSARCAYEGPYREMVLRSAVTLKLLTHAPSGGIVAAATAGLPEAVPGERNYDYRYVWMRDASFTVTAFLNLGYEREAAEFLRFLREADPSRGRHLRLMYALDGSVPKEEALDHLEGWRGVGPVRIGNAADGQDQYDIYGEFLIALHSYLDAVGYDPPVKVNDHLPEALANLTAHIIRRRHEPDHGIWELRTAKAQILHTKAMLWVGLDRAVQIAQASTRHRLAEPDAVATWERIAAEIRIEYHKHGWNDSVGAYTMAYRSPDLDAAVMRTVLFGAFDPCSDRMRATLDRIDETLGAGDLVYRYRCSDGMRGDEATFTACAFWRVGCLVLAGRADEATPLFERLLARANDVGLFAEEIDAGSGEQRGNLPQGFTHMAVINHAVRLANAQRSNPSEPGGEE